MSGIYIRVTGGLGNQIFQALKAFKIQLEVEKPIFFVDKYQNDFLRPKSFVESDKREFSLSKLGIIDAESSFHCDSPSLFCRFIFKYRVAKVFGKNGILKIFKNIYVDGYFIKGEKFGNEIKLLSEEIIRTHSIKKKEGAAIHVRAGDLLRQPQNLLITKDYYEKSISFLNKNYNVKNFFVFTEDVKFAKDLFSNLVNLYSIEFKSSNEISDFMSLMSYEFLISANSTFSWTAGLLGFSEFFVSTEFFYVLNDKPEVLPKELVMNFNGAFIEKKNY